MGRPRFAAILLAAGAGRRYGKPKALAHDGAWLRHGIAALTDAGADPVLVVLGAAADVAAPLVPVPARVVVAPDWDQGMGASLRAGLRALADADTEADDNAGVPVDAALVHLVDLPDIGADVVARVAAQVSAGVVARATYSGQDGHPVLLGRTHWADLDASLHGDRGARDWLAGRTDVVRVECGDLAAGADVDRPDGPA